MLRPIGLGEKKERIHGTGILPPIALELNGYNSRLITSEWVTTIFWSLVLLKTGSGLILIQWTVLLDASKGPLEVKWNTMLMVFPFGTQVSYILVAFEDNTVSIWNWGACCALWHSMLPCPYLSYYWTVLTSPLIIIIWNSSTLRPILATS